MVGSGSGPFLTGSETQQDPDLDCDPRRLYRPLKYLPAHLRHRPPIIVNGAFPECFEIITVDSTESEAGAFGGKNMKCWLAWEKNIRGKSCKNDEKGKNFTVLWGKNIIFEKRGRAKICYFSKLLKQLLRETKV